MFDNEDEISSLEHITVDGKAGRRHQIRMAARAAFYQCQTKHALERAIAHKARVEERSFEPGELVYAYRESNKKVRRVGPCTAIGREGQNYWLARGGRCLLCAPEHLREAKPEEVNEGLRLKMAMREVKQLLKEDEGDSFDEFMPDGLNEDPQEVAGHGQVEMLVEEEVDPAGQRARSIQSEARKAHVLDDVPISIKKSRVHQPFTVKRAISLRGQEKQLDKEIPWEAIPEEERHLYIEAEKKQWDEHVQYQAVRPLSLKDKNGQIQPDSGLPIPLQGQERGKGPDGQEVACQSQSKTLHCWATRS